MTQVFQVALPAFFGVVMQHGNVQLLEHPDRLRPALRQGFARGPDHTRGDGIERTLRLRVKGA